MPVGRRWSGQSLAATCGDADATEYYQRRTVLPSKAPTPAGLRRKIEQARKHKVQILFIQTNFDINNAQTAAKEVGARIVQINPESDAWPLEIQQITNYLSEIK